MGNCTSGTKKKKKGDSTPDRNSSLDNKPNEDVTYASIDHGPGKGSRTTRATTDDDCDYATVNVPAALQPKTESECSSKEECDDDYVLMG
ncbi:uncharacterized protein si:ch211-214p13.7 [Micropterus salmoides]|uniref:uncharacterized protein si:ch211-214p13.7 n=1 Tax=Micropterus salmoides TaxID=27706 RepID=UPI0018ED7831|nr:uncharacterized protein si:ch211-214p13.7 [Micropterus salmoides]XP_045910230.1 uncharacterized protein si:ch211-214p13.7 [Micropterus dolomieu]